MKKSYSVSEMLERYFGLIMAMPSTLYILTIVIFPAIFLVFISMIANPFKIVGEGPQFIGLKEYAMIFHPKFWEYTLNTTIIMVGSVFGGLLIQLPIALALNEVKHKTFFQTLILLPWVLPLSVSAMMYKWMLNTELGVINYILVSLGLIKENFPWLLNKWTALFMMIVGDIWAYSPLVIIVIYAGLQIIPKELYEAAEIDGASFLSRFRHITLPLLKPTIMPIIVLRTMFAFRVLEWPFVLTEGGPGDSTTTLSYLLWKYAFMFGEFTKAGVVGVILTILTFILVGVVMRAVGKTYFE